MKLTFDKNLFTQVGLDSGALSMLGGVTHRFLHPGQYRGVVYRGTTILGSFSIDVNPNSPLAQANIDLAAFDSSVAAAAPAADTGAASCGCQESDQVQTKFEVNSKGYVVFHVSSGAGGYAVRVSRAVEDPSQQNQFDSRKLNTDDIFSAIILRPGTYSVTNTLASQGKGEVTVSYPGSGKTPYRPPAPVTIESSSRGLEPAKVAIQPGQAILFQCRVPSRIAIELTKANDGPTGRANVSRPGWKKAALPEKTTKA
jgi:hypothetical protein